MMIADFSFLLFATSTLFQPFDVIPVLHYQVYVIHSLIHYSIYFLIARDVNMNGGLVVALATKLTVVVSS